MQTGKSKAATINTMTGVFIRQACIVPARGLTGETKMIGHERIKELHMASALRVLMTALGAMSGCEFASDTVGCAMSYQSAEFFERRRDVCGGALVVKGTRVPVRTLLASLAECATLEEILADFPTVTTDALRAVIAFAAASAEDDLPVPPIPVAA